MGGGRAGWLSEAALAQRVKALLQPSPPGLGREGSLELRAPEGEGGGRRSVDNGAAGDKGGGAAGWGGGGGRWPLGVVDCVEEALEQVR